MKFQYNLYPLVVRGIELSSTDLHQTDQILCPMKCFKLLLKCVKFDKFMIFMCHPINGLWCSKIKHLSQGTQYNENISQMDFGNSF